MTDSQHEHWELVEEIDERGRRLTRDEIDFIGALIDGDRKGTLTVGEMARIRALHRHRVEDSTEDEDD